MKRFVMVVALFPAVASADWVKLTGAYAQNLKRSPMEQACRAATALAAAQGSFASPTGKTVDATWAWARDSKTAAENAAGIVAVGLATAVETSKGCGAEQALARFAEERAEAHERGDFLFDPDIEALGRAAKLLGVARYQRLGREALAARYGGASGREAVERWFQVHPRALVGFDGAMAVRAAVAVGERELAMELADATVAAMPRWGERAGDAAQLATSRGALLEALVALDAKRYGTAVRDLVDHLLLTQSYDGTWAMRNTQATAYAVLGLAAAGDEFSVAAATHGRKWLRATQLEGGAWATVNDLAPEPFVGEVIHAVTAEALRAVASR